MQIAMLHHVLQQVKTPPAIYIGPIASEYTELIRHHMPRKLHLICDMHTKAVLPTSSPWPVLCFDSPPKADIANVDLIRHNTLRADGLIALGSGTLNDLVKYTSFLDRKPYLVIATAPSMNGYVSANASISENGYKHTLPAHSPVAVLADVPTLAAAPSALIQAGLGDTLCRSAIQADWLLSHLLLGSHYKAQYFQWSEPFERYLIESLQKKSPFNEDFITALFTALIISGLAMRDCGSSAPASQGEHMIAHCREMMFPQLTGHFHGLEVAVATLASSAWQERILSSPQAPAISYNLPQDYLPSHLIQEAQEQYRQKLPDIATVNKLNEKLAANWSSIAEQVNAIRLPHKELYAALCASGTPLTAYNLGWPEAEFQQILTAARFTRNRFTFLDLKPT